LDQKLVEKLVHTPGAEGEFGWRTTWSITQFFVYY
jgi:hypothetical protein